MHGLGDLLEVIAADDVVGDLRLGAPLEHVAHRRDLRFVDVDPPDVVAPPLEERPTRVESGDLLLGVFWLLAAHANEHTHDPPESGTMLRMSDEPRRHPRYRLALAVELKTGAGSVAAQTVGISRGGVSVKLSPAPALQTKMPITMVLPSGALVRGVSELRTVMAGDVCGLAVLLDDASRGLWDAFIDEEEATGSLWRMIGRFARAPEDEGAARGVVERGPRGPMFKSIDLDDPTLSYHRDEEEAVLRFHTVGENGEAYRVAFERHPADDPEACDLDKLPGFKEQARRAVRRVLREEMVLRFDESSPTVRARVCELVRGGFAYVTGGDDVIPVGLVSLSVGELFLVSMNGKSVFPHFSEAELERVACDTFRHDMPRAVFTSTSTPSQRPAEVPRAVTLPPVPTQPMPAKFQEGLDAVVFAQAANENVQTRRYGDREMLFHPTVWAKLQDEGGSELMGPTLQDREHVCLLALVGPGAPRVVRISKESKVRLMKSPK